MTERFFGRRGLSALCLGFAALLLAACGGLGGEPRIIATQPPATPAPQERGYPAAPPDMAQGAAIFAANCTDCHGIDGSGDGQLVASGQVPAPPDFTDPATARDQTPADYFEVITNGRIDKLMPPWAGSLSEDERWAAALYVYTLDYTQEQLDAGRELYATVCADAQNCPVAALTDPQQAVRLSDAALDEQLAAGAGRDLTGAQRRALAAHLRARGLANTGAIGGAQAPAATAEAEATETVTSLALSGQLNNATESGETPAGIPVTLYIIDPADPANRETLETTADAEGRFSFSDVPVMAARSYIAGATYRGRLFTGDLIAGDALTDAGDLSITIYELTEDPTVVTITGINTQVDAIGDGLQVLQEVVFENSSDRLYTNTLEVDEGIFASVVVGLPPGAVGLAFPGAPNRFVVSEEQQVIVDTIPVRPGEPHTIQFSYFVPYDGGAVIEQPVYYHLDGTVRLFVYPDRLTVAGEQLQRSEAQTRQNRTYAVYSGDLTLNPGDAVRYELSGQPVETATAGGTPAASNTPLLLIGGLIVEVLLIGGVLYWYFRRRSRAAAAPDRQARIDALARQIAELDNQHDTGAINADVYDARRAQLKQRLAQLMEKDSGE